jgi:hypothetical protein
MIYLIIKTTILSIVFIFIVHHVIYYFKDNLTIPKTKDLITITEKKYDDIHKTLNILNNTINNNNAYINQTTPINDLPKPSSCSTSTDNGSYYDSISGSIGSVIGGSNNIEYLSTSKNNNMKDELKFFIKQHQI